MIFTLAIFLILGLIDGDVVADLHRGKASQNWGMSPSDFNWFLEFHVLAVLWALFVIILLLVKKRIGWHSAGGMVIGIIVAYAIGFVGGIGVLDRYILHHQ